MAKNEQGPTGILSGDWGCGDERTARLVLNHSFSSGKWYNRDPFLCDVLKPRS